MSKTYFFSLSGERSGVRKVWFSSQKACHLGSTSAKGYWVLAAEVAASVLLLKSRREGRSPNCDEERKAAVTRSINNIARGLILGWCGEMCGVCVNEIAR